MGKYAERTEVMPERSRQEIEKTLKRYGCTGFAFAWEDDKAMIAFKADGRAVRFLVPVPDEDVYRYTPTKQWRSNAAMAKAYEQGIKQRWRALSLVIKAKLEAVETGIVTFEDEFLAHFVLPDGSTVSEKLGPDLDRVLEQGVPPLLGPGS